jgi:hypothetical protein
MIKFLIALLLEFYNENMWPFNKTSFHFSDIVLRVLFESEKRRMLG